MEVCTCVYACAYKGSRWFAKPHTEVVLQSPYTEVFVKLCTHIHTLQYFSYRYWEGALLISPRLGFVHRYAYCDLLSYTYGGCFTKSLDGVSSKGIHKAPIQGGLFKPLDRGDFVHSCAHNGLLSYRYGMLHKVPIQRELHKCIWTFRHSFPTDMGKFCSVLSFV